MDDSDVKCLPTNFVGKSRPSKVIENLYAKKEQAEQKAMEEMEEKKISIYKHYETLVENQSEELKNKLSDCRNAIKDDLLDLKMKLNNDNVQLFDKQDFTTIHERILHYTRKQCEIVNEFYSTLVALEKKKSEELRLVLKKTYNKIKRISFKLPREIDELLELEIERVNQSILCNNRNYVELKNHVQSEITNFAKNTIQELQQLKERWAINLRAEVEGNVCDLRAKYTEAFDAVVQGLAEKSKETNLNIRHSATLIDIDNPIMWLTRLRKTMAITDQNAQKILLNYKQAIVLIHNRYFQELTVIEEAIANMFVFVPMITKEQVNMYTPDLEDILVMYDNVPLDDIQKIWNGILDHLTKVLDNIQSFLWAASTLWKRHFKRTKELQVIILKDIENNIKINNTLCEPYETKLNVLIDTLRQESSKERLNKTFEDIKKMLGNIQRLYQDQHNSELLLLKRYKNMQEMKIDVLLAEIKRFLAVYPPDMEKDPKIQRKRASQTSEIADPTEECLPNQLIFLQFQIDAISNWQFGLWESINNYTGIARAEILADVEKWAQTHIWRLDKRLEIRMDIHALRLEILQAYIYRERLEELYSHQSRFDEHKRAIEERLATIKNEFKFCNNMYEDAVEDYKNKILEMDMKLLETENSAQLGGLKPIINSAANKCLEQIDDVTFKYLARCDDFFNYVKNSNTAFAKGVKLFFEGGNFSVSEIKELLKNLDKIEAQVIKTLDIIRKDVNTHKLSATEALEKKIVEINNTVNAIHEEHQFSENLSNKQQHLKRDLIREVCAFQYQLRNISDTFKRSKNDITNNCGNFNYFQEFKNGLENTTAKLSDVAAFLDEGGPVRFYTNKTGEEQVQTPLSSSKGRKHDDQLIQDITSQLFNFGFLPNKNTYFMSLNNILEKYWDDILATSKAFYLTHHRDFFLNNEKIPHSLPVLMDKLSKNFFHIQNQCETRTIQDTKEFLSFSSHYIRFIEECTDLYMQEYARKTLKHFEHFYDTEIKRRLNDTKDRIRKMQVELCNKLKPLYGHPKNRHMLEKLQIEAEILTREIADICQEVRDPYLEILREHLRSVLDEFERLNEEFPKVTQIITDLQTTIENLNLKHNEKVQLLRTIVDECPIEEFNADNNIISHCRTFLTSYDSTSYDIDNEDPIVPKTMSNPTVDYSHSDNAMTEETPVQISKTIESLPFTLGSEDDSFHSEIKSCYDKFCKEIKAENFEEILETFKYEWNYEIQKIMGLYKLRYD